MAGEQLLFEAFLSYAHADDDLLEGGITWLRRELQRGIRALTIEPFEIFLDADGSAFGQHWRSWVEDESSGVRFLIPILTPSYFDSPQCRAEAATFLELETKAGRRDLILPIYLLEANVLHDAELRATHPVAHALYERQYADWRDDALNLRNSQRMRQHIFALAKQIKAASERAAKDALPTVPEQGRGIRFRINEDGLIDRAPDEPHDVDENEARLESLQTGLVEACNRLLGSSGHNTLGFVLDTVRAYREAIDQPLADVQYTDVWRYGQRLQNLADAATRDVDRLEPSLEDDQHAALNDLLDLHGPFMLSTAEGRALQAMADRYRATREQQERQKEAIQAFKEAIEDTTDLVTEAVKKVIAEASDELGKGKYPERAVITAETTNQNFLSTAGRAAAVFVGGAAVAGIIENAAAGSDIGKTLVDVSIETLNVAGQASKRFFLGHEMILRGLVASSTDSFAWLNHLISWLKLASVPEGPAIATTELPEAAFWPPGRVFRDIDKPWCPEMVVIPAGEFLMGSPEDEKGREKDEGPQHRVKITLPFALGRYPVTFDEFDHFCEETGRDMADDSGWGRGRRPVIYVSWEDAKAYCDWLSGVCTGAYRLPTEAEWEYACRAGTNTAYAFGGSITEQQANFGKKLGKTSEVGAYRRNAFGLFDMHGNVYEWCDDALRGYTTDTVADPRGGDGTLRVLRGGSWLGLARNLRSARRGRLAPDDRDYVIGFRCALVQE